MPAVAGVQEWRPAGGLQQRHGGAGAVVGVQEGHAHAAHQHRPPQLNYTQPLPGHLHGMPEPDQEASGR